jgi:hypothetical protein
MLATLLLLVTLFAYRDVLSENPNPTWQWFFSEARPTPPSEGIERLLTFVPDEIAALHLRRQPLVVQTSRTEDGWSNGEHGDAVDQYLDSLANQAVILRLDALQEGEDLKDFGLSPPRAVIEIYPRNGAPIILNLGRPNPASTGVYARVGKSGPIVLTGAIAVWELDKVLRTLLPLS